MGEINRLGNGTQLMTSVGFHLKNWRLWHVCLQNKFLSNAGGLQFANSFRHVPVRISEHHSPVTAGKLVNGSVEL